MTAAKKAFSKCVWDIDAQAREIFDKTTGAYSFDRYGERSWLANIKFLLTKFTAEQVEWIMFSKHARWAADMCESRRNTIPKSTMEMYFAAGNLTGDTEMPGVRGASPTAEKERAAKLARIKKLREEMLQLMSEVGA